VEHASRDADDPLDGAGESDTLGRKLRKARKARGLSLQKLSERAQLSIGVISQIERGLTSPSFRSLRRLSSALDMPVRAFFDEDHVEDAVPSTDRSVVVRPRNRRVLRLEKKGITTEYLDPDTSGRLQMMLLNIEPGGGLGRDFDTHDGEEGGLVLSGTLKLTLDSVTYLLAEGDSFRFPADRRHAFCNPGPNFTRVVWFITPPLY